MVPARLSILYTAQALEQPSGCITPRQRPAAAEKTHAFPPTKPCATEQLEYLPVPPAGLRAALPGRVRFIGHRQSKQHFLGEQLKYPPGKNPVPVSRILSSDHFMYNVEAILEETM